MQYAVLRRPGTESTRIPHFLYIDEFPDFICDSTEAIFTMYRKYRVGTVISAQNLDQLNVENKKFRNTIIANCVHKIVFGNNTPEDNEWWSKEIGEEKKWTFNQTYDTAKGKYKDDLTGIAYKPDIRYKAGKIQSTKFKQCLYKIVNDTGKYENGIGVLDFVQAKYKEKHEVKKFNFEKFTSDDSDTDPRKNKKKKTILTSFSEDDDSELELDPIRTDISDSLFETNSEDAIISNNITDNE